MEKHIIPADQFPVKIDNNIYMLGNYFFNLFLVIGKHQSAIFEVGISAVADAVISQLEGLNVQPNFLISSHPHSDHITGLPGLAERFPKAQIIAAQGAREFLEHPKAGALLFKEDRFMGKRLADFHLTPGRPSLETIPDLKNADIVTGKKRLDLGGISLDLIKAEGHSPGSIIGIVPERKIIFCSDSLGFHFPGRGYQPLFFTRADAYISTLNFILDFKPAIICPAHQGPLKGDDALKGAKNSLNITLDIIKMIQNSSLPDEVLAEKIFKQSYKDEFTIYTEDNIKNCSHLLVKRAKEAATL